MPSAAVSVDADGEAGLGDISDSSIINGAESVVAIDLRQPPGVVGPRRCKWGEKRKRLEG